MGYDLEQDDFVLLDSEKEAERQRSIQESKAIAEQQAHTTKRLNKLLRG